MGADAPACRTGLGDDLQVKKSGPVGFGPREQTQGDHPKPPIFFKF